MANQKLSELTAATVLNDTDEVYLNQGGTSKRITVGTLRSLLGATDRRYWYELFDDLDGAYSATYGPWGVISSGTGAGVSVLSTATPEVPTSDRFGVQVITTGTTSTGYAALARGGTSSATSDQFKIGAETNPFIIEAGIYVPNIPTSTQDFEVRIGLAGKYPLPVNGVQAVMFQQDDEVYWGIRSTIASSSDTWLGSTLFEAGGDFFIRLEITSSEAVLYVNGVEEVFFDDPLPTAAMGFSMGVQKIAGTSARTAHFDYVWLRRKLTDPRNDYISGPIY